MESMIKSSESQDGNSLLRLAQDALAPCSTPTDQPLSESLQRLAVLMTILHGITENTFNGDVISLAIYRAKSLCEGMQISEELFAETCERYVAFSKALRANNPMSGMF